VRGWKAGEKGKDIPYIAERNSAETQTWRDDPFFFKEVKYKRESSVYEISCIKSTQLQNADKFLYNIV
jgi:hypothetical protein